MKSRKSLLAAELVILNLKCPRLSAIGCPKGKLSPLLASLHPETLESLWVGFPFVVLSVVYC